jgi:protein-tyrosine-phosphatase
MKVLFVCSGNICRSPMAAEYCRLRAREAGFAMLAVDSAGTLGIEGEPAPEEARRVMAEIGVDLSRHRSRGLRAEDLASADYTIVMERRHLKFLGRHHPDATDRRLLLRAFEEGSDPHPYPPDVADPIGMPIESFRELVPQISRSVDHLLAFLRERA